MLIKLFDVNTERKILNDFDVDVYDYDTKELLVSVEFSTNYSVVNAIKETMNRLGYVVHEITVKAESLNSDVFNPNVDCNYIVGAYKKLLVKEPPC